MFGSHPSVARRPSHAQRKMSSLIPGLLIIALLLSQTACSPFFTASANNDTIQEEVDEAVAATMVAFYVAATQSAASLASSPVAPTAVPPTPTAVPVEPSPTAVPPLPTIESSPTSLPAPVIITLVPAATAVSSALPTIWAEVNTNCRYGPSINYGVIGYLTVGITSYVYGSDTYKEWWYIENPQKKGNYCWVWSQSTHVDGNVSAVPVVAAASQPAPVTYPLYGYGYNYTYGYGYNYGYNYNPYGCNYNYTNNCYCPCKFKKLTCNQKKKWCIPVMMCKCKTVCYNPCYQNPYYNPYTQVNWNNCPSTGCY